MTTSRSDDYSDALPEGTNVERQELVPALSPEIQERDPSLIALVRNLAALEIRLTQLLPPRSTDEHDTEVTDIILEMETAELGLRKYAEELAINRKVDHYTSMLAYLEGQRDALAREVKRLSARKRAAETIIERMLGAAHYALNLLPKPRYGVRELEGANSSLALVKNPGRVVVTDQAQVPPAWRRVTVKMSLATWMEIVKGLGPAFLQGMQTSLYKVTDEVMLSELAPALKRGEQVPGVEWRQDHRVERR